MTRALGLFGFTGGFLIISPDLRQMVLDGFGGSLNFIQNHGPFSYVGIVVAVFGLVSLILVSGSRPR